MPKTKSVPRVSGDADILRSAQEASGRSQVRFAVDVLGVNDRSFRGWISAANPDPAWPPVVRLAWLIERHPDLADEIDAAFNPA